MSGGGTFGFLGAARWRYVHCPWPPAGCCGACAATTEVWKGVCKGHPKGCAQEIAKSIQKPPTSFALWLSGIPWGQWHREEWGLQVPGPVRGAQVGTRHLSFAAQNRRQPPAGVRWTSAFSRPPRLSCESCTQPRASATTLHVCQHWKAFRLYSSIATHF